MRAPGHRLRPSAAGTRLPARIAVVVIVGLLAACTTTTGAKGQVTGAWGSRPRSTSTTTPQTRGEPTAPPPLDWKACTGGQCARLTVPLDDSTPRNGQTIGLAMFRRPAGNPAQRIGSLLVNPGGPGASGISLARSASSFLPTSVLDRFDVVGWDPRGAGASAPVVCGDHLDYLFSGDTSPDNPAEWSALNDVSQRFANACGAGSGKNRLSNISTVASVHDMERIRLALGDPKLTFVGFSYGTELGSVYATLYPDRVRAMVLDGAVDTSLSSAEAAIEQAEGLEHGLDEFFADCGRDPSCPIHADPAGAYQRVITSIESAPLPTRLDGEDRVVTPAITDVAVAAALYSKTEWPNLRQALTEAENGNGKGLLRLFDSYMGRKANGIYDDQWPSFLAISCLDGPSIGGPGVYPSVEAQAAARAPRFGASNVGLGLACAYWPVPTAAPLPSVSAPTAAPIVVIGTVNDPITPLRWAQALTRQLGGSAHLVTYNGQGHTSFGSGDPCLDNRIAGYLVDLTLPPAGLECGAG